jgi:hypothetical protein
VQPFVAWRVSALPEPCSFRRHLIRGADLKVSTAVPRRVQPIDVIAQDVEDSVAREARLFKGQTPNLFLQRNAGIEAGWGNVHDEELDVVCGPAVGVGAVIIERGK